MKNKIEQIIDKLEWYGFEKFIIAKNQIIEDCAIDEDEIERLIKDSLEYEDEFNFTEYIPNVILQSNHLEINIFYDRDLVEINKFGPETILEIESGEQLESQEVRPHCKLSLNSLYNLLIVDELPIDVIFKNSLN